MDQLTKSLAQTSVKNEPNLEDFIQIWTNSIRQILNNPVPLNDACIAAASVKAEFSSGQPTRDWFFEKKYTSLRKDCFNYLLIDPREAYNLMTLINAGKSEAEVRRLFSKAVFYIGKGTKPRPQDHLDEALDYENNRLKPVHYRIQDIWDSGRGVVSLQVFNNVVPSEALTNKAAMIAALGIDNLTNQNEGTAYGVAAEWQKERLERYGWFLLLKALQILCVEGMNEIRREEFNKHLVHIDDVPKKL